MASIFEITESDVVFLNEYLEEAKRLTKYKVISQKLLNHLAVNFHADKEKGWGATLDSPDEEALEAMYSSLRKLMSDSESVFFQRIANIVCKVTHEIDPKIATNTSEMKKEFERLKRGPEEMIVTIDQYKLTHEFCINLLFNGRIFHRDKELVDILRSLEQNPLSYQMFLFIAISGLTEYVKLCTDLGNIVYYVLQNQRKE